MPDFVYVLAAAMVFAGSTRLAAQPLQVEPSGRPSKWAQKLVRKGLPNLHKVTDDLFRGAQPTTEGMRELKAMGIKTVINLRSFHSDLDELGDTRLSYEHISMKAWRAKEKEVVRFLKIVTDKRRLPVFVHCQHGADRTGLMCALYRIAVCDWTKQDALAEMTQGGFGYHKVWKNLIRFIEKLDLAEMKEKAGLIPVGRTTEPAKADPQP